MRARILIGAALAVSCALVFAEVRSFEFLNFDDPDYVLGNRIVRSGLTLEGLEWAATTTATRNWHPLTWLSLMLDVELFGVSAGAHHLVNLLLHAANAVLLFLLLARFTGAVWRSAFVAALFAVHPLHVESVAWISERKDVLCTLFWLGSTWAYARWATGSSRWAYGLTTLLMALGLMAKPMVVTLPFALLLFDVWPLQRLDLRDRLDVRAIGSLVREKLPLFALSAAASAVTWLAQERMSWEKLPLVPRLENAAVSYVRYLGKAVWPADLSIYYPHPFGWPAWQVLGSVALLAVMTIAALLVRRRAPYVIAGWLFFLGVLVPTVGIVQVGAQSMADRYTYIPLIGIFWIVAWGALDLLQRLRFAPVVLGIGAGVVLVGLGVEAHGYVSRWRDSISIAEHALRTTPENYMAHLILGRAFLKRDDLDRAEHHLAKAARRRPGWAGPLLALGELYEQRDDLVRAEQAYRAGLERSPGHTRGWNRLGRTLAKQGRLEAAHEVFERTTREHPGDAEAYESLGIVAEMRGDVWTAVTYYRLALARQPDFRHARRRLGWILATSPETGLGEAEEAIEHLERACEQTEWRDPEDLDGLAAAYAKAGRFAEAVRTAERASAAARETGRAQRARVSEERGALYRSGRSLRMGE
jgi:tetratricopeptide (TPR) repeat protein